MLGRDGCYRLTPEESETIRSDFDATFSSDEEGERVMAHYAREGYLMDPHTATCLKACRELRKDALPTVLYSTAEWTKFSSTVAKALGISAENDLAALEAVSEKLGVEISEGISRLFERPVVHTTIVGAGEIMREMLAFL